MASTGKMISDDEATQRMLSAFEHAKSVTKSVINEMGNMQAEIPTFWQGDAASTFSASVTTWLEGANKIQTGLQDLSTTMADTGRDQANTESTNRGRARVQTAITY